VEGEVQRLTEREGFGLAFEPSMPAALAAAVRRCMGCRRRSAPVLARAGPVRFMSAKAMVLSSRGGFERGPDAGSSSGCGAALLRHDAVLTRDGRADFESVVVTGGDGVSRAAGDSCGSFASTAGRPRRRACPWASTS
jgi:hypothetical protein